MNVFAEFGRSRIRCQIDKHSIEIKISADFFKKIKGKESYQMFFDRQTNRKIKDFIFFHRNKLPFVTKLKYMFGRNTVVVVLDDYVSQLMTIELIHAYVTLAFDAREVFILKGSEKARHSDLRALEQLKPGRINNGRNDETILISQLN
jgi:hypothetical protein